MIIRRETILISPHSKTLLPLKSKHLVGVGVVYFYVSKQLKQLYLLSTLALAKAEVVKKCLTLGNIYVLAKRQTLSVGVQTAKYIL